MSWLKRKSIFCENPLIFICDVFSLLYYYSFDLRTFADLKPYIWLVKLYISLIAVTDTSIAVTLIVLLRRSRTGFEKSDNIINRLIVFTVNTGAIPSLLSLLIIVMVSTASFTKNRKETPNLPTKLLDGSLSKKYDMVIALLLY